VIGQTERARIHKYRASVQLTKCRVSVLLTGSVELESRGNNQREREAAITRILPDDCALAIDRVSLDEDTPPLDGGRVPYSTVQ
jgi:hypothetical protein